MREVLFPNVLHWGKSGDFVERSNSFQGLLNEVQNCTVLKNAGSSIPHAGLLILRDGAISHNRPKIAINRIIHEKSHNLFKIAQFKKRKTKISLCIKFSDILIVI